MNLSFDIESISSKEQYKVYHYLRNKFEINREEQAIVNIPVKEIEEFPSKLKFALLRNGINDVANLLKLNEQDLINLSGVGLKSREIIIKFCEAYKV